MKYYVAVNGQHQGPFEIEQLRTMGLTPESLVWNESMTEWTPVGNIQELSELFYSAPLESQYQQQQQYQPSYQQPQQQYQPQQTQYDQQQQYYDPGMPNTWFVPALLITLFCCSPCGLVALAFSLKVEPRYYAGYYTEANDAANKAKTWSIVGIILGVLFWVGYIALISSMSALMGRMF